MKASSLTDRKADIFRFAILAPKLARASLDFSAGQRDQYGEYIDLDAAFNLFLTFWTLISKNRCFFPILTTMITICDSFVPKQLSKLSKSRVRIPEVKEEAKDSILPLLPAIIGMRSDLPLNDNQT